jgi:hypothetical protein
MNPIRKLLSLILILCFSTASRAQIEVVHMSFNGFSAFGFGGFFNFAIPVSDADYVTGEVGLNAFSSNDNNVATAPILASYRYTLDRTGAGFYLEPNLGYSIGGTDIQTADQNGYYSDLKISGPAAGLSFGYLFPQTGTIQFNLGFRYEHVFAPVGQNEISFRISHAFTFGRRN